MSSANGDLPDTFPADTERAADLPQRRARGQSGSNFLIALSYGRRRHDQTSLTVRGRGMVSPLPGNVHTSGLSRGHCRESGASIWTYLVDA